MIDFKFERKANGVRAAKVRRQGGVGQGKARRIEGRAVQGRKGQRKARRGRARRSMIRQRKAWQNIANRESSASLGNLLQGSARQQGSAIQNGSGSHGSARLVSEDHSKSG